MLYRILVDLAFSDLATAEQIRDQAKALLSMAITINPGTPDQAQGYVILEECRHDENPPGPCKVVSQDLTPGDTLPEP